MNYSASLLEVVQFVPRSLRLSEAWVGHCPFAAWVILTQKPKLFVELGTFGGNSYFAFCQAVQLYRTPTRCYAVDTWQGDEHGGFYDETVYQYVAQHNREHYAAFSTLLRTTFDEASAYFAEGSVDLLHIDGLHTYEVVRHDFYTWLPKIAQGGLVLLHDTMVRERGFGVWRLWRELVEQYPYHLEFAHSFGLGVLWIGDAKPPTWLIPDSKEQAFLQRYFAALGEQVIARYKAQELTDALNQHLTNFERERSRWAEQAAQLERERSRWAEQAAQLERERSRWAEQAAQLEREHSRWAEQAAQLERERSRWAEQAAQLERENARLRTQLQQILTSRSWRLTRPLRFLARLGRAVFRRDGQALKAALRPVFVRCPRLRKCYARIRVFWQGARVGLRQSLEANNQAAWQALAERRADPYALASAFPAPYFKDWPDVDLTVVTYQSAQFLPKFLASLLAQRYPLERICLIVVDHESSDGTWDVLENWRAQHGHSLRGVDIVRRPNLGFGAGQDYAIRRGDAPYCLIANPDLEFHPASLTTVVRYAQADPKEHVACWELRQLPYEHPKHYDPVTLETQWCSHACILMRRSAYQDVGGYDPRLFLYGEDVELSYRLRSFGYVLKYCPDATVTHHAYAFPGQLKPYQFAGSAAANLLIRWRYGSVWAKCEGLWLYAGLLLGYAADRSLRGELIRAGRRLLTTRSRRPKGDAPAHYPIRGLDYELARLGAFWPQQRLESAALPLVSVIIRTHGGRELYLKQALASALHQTYPRLEILVSEDGGNRAWPVVEEIKAKAPAGVSLRYLANEKLGRSEVANRALEAACGQYCLFLDDDDLLYADHIETLMAELIANPHCSAAYAPALEAFTEALPDGYREVAVQFPKALLQPWDYQILLDHNYLPIQGVLFAYSLYRERGGLDSELDCLEDWNLWLRYGYGNSFAYVPKATSLYKTPANPYERERRQLRLHNAYLRAKQKALDQIERWACDHALAVG